MGLASRRRSALIFSTAGDLLQRWEHDPRLAGWLHKWHNARRLLERSGELVKIGTGLYKLNDD